MAQFDVYRIEGGGLVLDCQSDPLRDLGSRVVAPLRPADDAVLLDTTDLGIDAAVETAATVVKNALEQGRTKGRP